MTLPHDDVGSGPAVVLIHAGIADRTMWAEQLQPIADAGYRVVALDMPGFGEAPIPPGEQAWWVDVIRLMDGLSIERAALVGVSVGAEVALRVALVSPGRVSKLVLVGGWAPEVEASPELESAQRAENEAVERGDIEAAVAAVVDTWTLPDAPADLRDRVATMQRRALVLQAEAGDVTHAADPLEEQPERLSEVSMPVLVAVGERDKHEFLRGAEILAEGMPNARHAVIPGAGHLAPLETPEAFRELLLDFL